MIDGSLDKDPINKSDDVSNCLVWCKRRDQPLALLPDHYQMLNYLGRGIAPFDPVPFKKKRPCAMFAGAVTGSLNLLENQRLKACLWSLRNRDIARFSITSVSQVSPARAILNLVYLGLINILYGITSVWPQHKPEELVSAHSQSVVDQIVSPSRIEEAEQLEYQCVASIEGNAAAWDRPVWVMSSKSIP